MTNPIADPDAKTVFAQIVFSTFKGVLTFSLYSCFNYISDNLYIKLLIM